MYTVRQTVLSKIVSGKSVSYMVWLQSFLSWSWYDIIAAVSSCPISAGVVHSGT